MRLSALLAFFLLCSVSWPVWRAEADTLIHYTSDPSDFVGQGEERLLSAVTGYTVSMERGFENNVEFDVQAVPSQGVIYGLTIGPPWVSQFAVGNYSNAIRIGSDTQPTLDFFAEGRDGETSGSFQVLEVTYDAYGNLLTFAADFVQHSNSVDAATYGQIRYNSDIPYLTPAGLAQLAASQYSVSEKAGSLRVKVTRAGGSTGALSVGYATADGTDLAGRDYTAVSGTLSWPDGDTSDRAIVVPILDSGNPAQGNGTFLVNLSGTGISVQSQATVTVVNDNSTVTYVHFITDPDPVTGHSTERTFDLDTGYVITATQSVGATGPTTSAGAVIFNFDNQQAAGATNSQFWTLDLSTPQDMSLAVGDYEDAVQYPVIPSDGDHPGLDLSGNGSGTDSVTGNFQVLEAEYDDAGNVAKFAANFTEYPDGSAQAIRGQVRYNSTVQGAVLIPAVSVTTRTPVIEEVDGTPGVFEIVRTGDLSEPLTVTYQLKGNAVNGQDYQLIEGTRTIKAGQASARVKVVPLHTVAGGGSVVTVKLKLKASPDGSYTVGTASKATVRIDKNG